MPINPTAALYAAAYVGGQLGGIALGTAIVKKVLPQRRQSYSPQIGYFELSKQIQDLKL